MNLRTVTIWTTATMLIVTIAIAMSVVYDKAVVHHSFRSKGMGEIVWLACAVWLFTGLLSAISFVIACKLKHTRPVSIILVSTMIYGIFYGWGFMCMESEFAPLSLVAANICSLPIMIPAWIFALLLNRRYVTITPNPGTARSTG